MKGVQRSHPFACIGCMATQLHLALQSVKCTSFQLPTPLGPPGRMGVLGLREGFLFKVKTASSPAVPPPQDSLNTP